MAVPRQWSSAQTSLKEQPADGPNLIFVFADQWRAQATGYAGNKAVKTPNLDKLAEESVNFTNAVSGCPVCSPYRASLLTGRYWLTHGIFYNDKPLNPDATTIGKVYRQAGYKTAYIGKWHVDGHGRSSFIPKERRQGFEFWRVCECTHDYNHSLYYGDVPEKKYWPGYDAIAQTREAQQYIRQHANSSTSSPSKSPFALFVSWGPPHNPYQTAPEKYRKMFPDPSEIPLRPNVPDSLRSQAQEELAGYYAHIAALDDCIGDILSTIDECGIEKNTIFVFTSDHGDMLHSHGQTRKQKPWEESVRVPFIVRYPAAHGKAGRRVDMPINTPDIMPTLLGLSGLAIPKSVEGGDFSGVVTGTRSLDNDAALIMCPVPFHEWGYRRGGREYRGVRTRRYTYVRDLNGPWLLYDNQADPYQLMNLCNSPENAQIQQELEKQLSRRLEETNDKFLTGSEYMALWNYQWDANDGPTSQK
ncbi:MAG: sulfatase [Planctomycetes bacterium RBG_16_55_9]|nr:MAG: sulfatase [Planctomycetes bacterium RBG_16_55_9]